MFYIDTHSPPNASGYLPSIHLAADIIRKMSIERAHRNDMDPSFRNRTNWLRTISIYFFNCHSIAFVVMIGIELFQRNHITLRRVSVVFNRPYAARAGFVLFNFRLIVWPAARRRCLPERIGNGMSFVLERLSWAECKRWMGTCDNLV